MQTRYLNEFFSLNSSGDVLNACGPINNGAKEITEAMAIRRQLRDTLISQRMEYTVIDFCSGNALVPVLTAFTLPAKQCIAVDKKKHHRNWHLIKRFEYLELDIYNSSIPKFINENAPCILTGCHACGNLSKRIIELYHKTKAKHLVLMPCCNGTFEKQYPDFIREKVGKPNLWVLELMELAKGRAIEDKYVISPRNKIILASK